MRLALGAQPAQIQRQVLREGMALTAAGLGLGATATLLLGGLLQGLLFGVTPRDATVFVSAAAVLPAAALAACWLPARRAARRNPVAALRAE